jgi:hypothetical protein
MKPSTSEGGVRRISMRVVEQLAPGQIVWDTEVRGFGIRCQRAKKIYILKAAIAGRQRWFSIGEHGAPWTPDLARKEAQRLEQSALRLPDSKNWPQDDLAQSTGYRSPGFASQSREQPHC